MKQFEITIESDKNIRQIWKEVWQYRELFYFLAWRDILVRYKQTIIGVAWGIIRPLLTMIVLTIVFGKIAKLPSGEIPYPVLVFVAMIPWQFFSSSFSQAGNSLISNTQLISKVYFPRIIIPTTAVVLSLIDLLMSFVILFLLMLWYGVFPDFKIIILPLLLLVASLTSLGAGYIISALNVKFRDFKYVIPFIIQFGLYISPVGFSSAVVPEQWRLIYSLNPMVGVIDGFRWAILGSDVSIYWPGFIISIFFSMTLFVFGILYFYKTERNFADII